LGLDTSRARIAALTVTFIPGMGCLPAQCRTPRGPGFAPHVGALCEHDGMAAKEESGDAPDGGIGSGLPTMWTLTPVRELIDRSVRVRKGIDRTST
jgi:hypothetical protein